MEHVILTKLYSTCIVHSCVPPSLMKVVFVPLIKDKSKSIDIKNYRPIAICPYFQKII